MSTANTRQVGGTHYAVAGSYQHWDMVLEYGLGYFEGVATKYVLRHNKKNGREDLEKSVHYLDKLIESTPGLIRAGTGTRTHMRTVDANFIAKANQVGDAEAVVLQLIVNWMHTDNLRRAKCLIGYIIVTHYSRSVLEEDC